MSFKFELGRYDFRSMQCIRKLLLYQALILDIAKQEGIETYIIPLKSTKERKR